MDAYVGEIRAFAFSYVPQNWLICQGQLLPIQQYQALAVLLGNVYGGTPQAGTFGLPNLQGLAWIGQGAGPGLTQRAMGLSYGYPTALLDSYAYLTPHNHTVNAMAPVATNLTSNTLGTPVANSSWLSQEGNVVDATHFRLPKPYTPATVPPTVDTTFSQSTISPACGNASGSVDAHGNIQPYLTLVMCICSMGTFPMYN